MIYSLNLPKLSDTLVSSLIAQATVQFTADNIAAFNTRHPWPYTADQLTASNVITRMGAMVEDATGLVAELGASLPVSVNYEFFMTNNTSTATPVVPAVMPPFRGLAAPISLNCYIQLDGSPVYNTFFDEAPNQAADTVYDLGLTPTASYTLEQGAWYAFDPTIVRSITGITGTTIMVALTLADATVTFPDLLAAQPALFGTAYTANPAS